MAGFFCRADADSVFWTFNNISVNQLDDPNISQGDGPAVDGFRTRILRIVTDVQHNNSVIQCRSFTSGEGVTPSNPVLLMVQGTYVVPASLHTSIYMSLAILIMDSKYIWLDVALSAIYKVLS